MSGTLTFPSRSSRPQTPTPQASLHTCELRGTSCQQMAESQESSSFCSRPGTVSRRHSADGSSADSDRFHPYLRQFSEGAVTAGAPPPPSPQSLPHFGQRQEAARDRPASWEGYDDGMQFSYPELPAVPGEPSCFQAQSFPAYSSPNLQASCRPQYPSSVQSHSSEYPVENISPHSLQRSPAQSIFPKPIYSYSILIFMALKSSKTGSLPVSEIYSFMTEHFPYFKTAPDGWKNSVRHNLSLNKCFEKVENKNGNSSRKGCLWALNPARVEKMQEELHKWRRKDPLTIRRSMARPEDLDHLLGHKPGKPRPYTSPALVSTVAPSYSSASSPRAAPPHYLLAPPPSQQSSYAPPTSSYAGSSFALYSAGGPSPAGLHSATLGKVPPAYGAALQAEGGGGGGGGPRGRQELLLEGELSYEVDTLNPSLTDLQLQGNLWEELREDSLASDSQVVASTPPPPLLHPRLYSSCVQAVLPVGHGAEPPGCRAEESSSEQQGGASALQLGPYSGMEALSGYLTCCTASISLM